MAKSYAELQEMITILKLNKDQQIWDLESKLNNLQAYMVYLLNVKIHADMILTKHINAWERYKILNLNAAKINRMLAKVQQTFEAVKRTILKFDLLGKCENIYTTFQESSESMDQTITSIAQLIAIFENEEKSENNALKLEATIEQAKLSFQANFNEILNTIQKIEEHYRIFLKILDDIEKIVCSDIKQYEKTVQKDMPEPILSVAVKYEDPSMLDDQFSHSPRKPKQSKKDAYIAALKIWAENNENSTVQKIDLANYLFNAASYHTLAKEKRYRPLCIFSLKTTHMGAAQGLLAHGLSDNDKQQLLFDEKYLKRKQAFNAYHKEMGFNIKKT